MGIALVTEFRISELLKGYLLDDVEIEDVVFHGSNSHNVKAYVTVVGRSKFKRFSLDVIPESYGTVFTETGLTLTSKEEKE